jgi:hypothetical protein
MTTTTTSPSPTETATTITEHEMQQVERVNATGLQPVVFVHGLWLLPSSWDRWATVLEEAGYTALTPGWPDDPETIVEVNASFKLQQRNIGVTEIAEIPNRGHALTIDSAWREVADTALAFVRRYV